MTRKRIEWTRATVLERVTVTDSGCWTWRNVRKDGYATVGNLGRTWEAHRFVYTKLVGPIPEGMHLDHTCHTDDPTCEGGSSCSHRACVNPDHLEIVTPAENTRRKFQWKTECANGHPLEGWNVIPVGINGRACRECMYARNRERPRAKAVKCLGCAKRTTVPGQVCKRCLRDGTAAA